MDNTGDGNSSGKRKAEDGEDATSSDRVQPPFVIRNIITKKKDPQQKMEKYFPVAKAAKMARLEKNFQGFPLSECVYEAELRADVYCPPCCRDENGERKWTSDSLCHHCLLRPCMVKMRWEDIMGYCEDCMVFENDNSDGIRFKITGHMESICAEIYGAEFASKYSIPSCALEVVSDYHRVKLGMDEAEEDEEDPDEELIGGAVDGAEYLKSWRTGQPTTQG
jgi:hypothetical protein